MENIVEIKHLTKTYPGFQLNDVSMQIPAGTIMGFIGENGAGKSTTIRSILQLIHIDAGEIKVFGRDMKEYEKQNKEEIGVVLSDSMFPEAMNAVKIGKVLQQVYRNWDSQTYESYLTKFKLPVKKNIKELSTGMRMKLSIACALSHHPRLLILDEATSGLDPIIRDEILDVFLEFIGDGEHSILISSHITSDIEKAADYVTFIHEGKILLSEEKDILLEQYGVLHATPEQFASIQKTDYSGYRKSRFSIELLVKDREDIQRRFPEAIIDRATLEDIMLYTVKGEH